MYWIRQINGRDWHWWHVLVLFLPHSRDLRGWRGRNSGGDCVASRIRPHTVLHIPVYVLKYTWYPSCCLPLSDRNVKYRTDTPVMNAFCFNTQFFYPLDIQNGSMERVSAGPWLLAISFCGTSYHHRAQIIVKTSFCSNLESRVFVLGTTHNNTQQLHLFLSQKPSVTSHQSQALNDDLDDHHGFVLVPPSPRALVCPANRWRNESTWFNLHLTSWIKLSSITIVVLVALLFRVFG